MLEQEQVEIPIKPSRVVAGLIADLRQLRETITNDRGGALIDLDGILEEVRDERDHELFGMR